MPTRTREPIPNQLWTARLAKQALRLPVLTADREWRHVEVEELAIEMVR